jgi:quinol monooxygenase YgiN
MWAQLIRAQLKPGTDLSTLAEVLKAAEQPESGLLRELFMHDQDDPNSVYVLAVFESEEKAREREHDPRRAEGQRAIQEVMAKVLAAPPEFTNLTVNADWAP